MCIGRCCFFEIGGGAEQIDVSVSFCDMVLLVLLYHNPGAGTSPESACGCLHQIRCDFPGGFPIFAVSAWSFRNWLRGLDQMGGKL